MQFTLSFDPLHLLGLVVCGYFASLVGNVIGTIIVALTTPTLDGERLFKAAAMMTAAGSLTGVKIVIALIAGCAAMAFCGSTGVALLATMATTALLGFVCTVLLGLSMRI